MGMDHSVYVGAYLKVPHAKQPDQKVKHSCSANCGFKDIRANMKFCPSCGAAVDARSSGAMVLEAVSCYRLPEAFDEKLWCPESCYGSKAAPCSLWLPNIRGFGQSFGEHDGEQVVELDPGAMVGELAAFSAQFQPLSDWLKATYGIEPSIHYGVVSYWS